MCDGADDIERFHSRGYAQVFAIYARLFLRIFTYHFVGEQPTFMPTAPVLPCALTRGHRRSMTDFGLSGCASFPDHLACVKPLPRWCIRPARQFAISSGTSGIPESPSCHHLKVLSINARTSLTLLDRSTTKNTVSMRWCYD